MSWLCDLCVPLSVLSVVKVNHKGYRGFAQRFTELFKQILWCLLKQFYTFYTGLTYIPKTALSLT
ncbi:hypothetical protein BDD43_5818 [Mucilaginibacter gracilis]|uniref:Uncharacterized protein n=1 Tax=Mucilaginibacter gracilis TaxID=423350 RepID=A0A495J9G3_9SPHI|nr:hypothetical protein BDD43_5818 [Mucilaginibacter gracilis]